MNLEQLEFLCKYPFFAQGKLNFSEEVLKGAKERIQEAIEYAQVTTKLDEYEPLSFWTSLLILALIDENSLTERYLIAESKRLYYLLEDEENVSEETQRTRAGY